MRTCVSIAFFSHRSTRTVPRLHTVAQALPDFSHLRGGHGVLAVRILFLCICSSSLDSTRVARSNQLLRATSQRLCLALTCASSTCRMLRRMRSAACIDMAPSCSARTYGAYHCTGSQSTPGGRPLSLAGPDSAGSACGVGGTRCGRQHTAGSSACSSAVRFRPDVGMSSVAAQRLRVAGSGNSPNWLCRCCSS